MTTKFLVLPSLDISDVDTVSTWGDKRPRAKIYYFIGIFSPSLSKHNFYEVFVN